MAIQYDKENQKDEFANKPDPQAVKLQKLQTQNLMNKQNSLSNFMNDSSASLLNIGNKQGKKFFETDQLTIYAWNVNGVRAFMKKNKLQDFFKMVDPDII